MLKKTTLLAALLLSTIEAENIAFTANHIRSFPLGENIAGIKINYNRINDEIDIFDVKQSELQGIANLGSIGDSNGLDVSLGYGINQFISLFYNYEYLGLDYIDSKLKNSKNEFYTKVLIYHNPMNFLEVFSADIGYVRNSADDLDITDVNTLNSMIQKIQPTAGLYINGSTVTFNGQTVTFPFAPFVRIGELSDNSFYLRLLTGIRYEKNIIDFYAGLKYTSINTLVTLEPQEALQDIIQALGYPASVDFERNEKTAFFGFNYTGEFGNFILDAGYEYLTIWGREDEIEETESNHIINGALSYAITNDLLIFIGGKLMLNQFNGVIPYLYNQYTKTKYDKKYGYAKIGLVYNFDTSSLANIGGYANTTSHY